MQVIHSIPSLSPESGGPARSVPGLCASLAQAGVEVDLVSLGDSNLFTQSTGYTASSFHVTVVPGELSKGLKQFWLPEFSRKLYSLINEQRHCLVHDHGVWLPSNLAAFRVTHKVKIPFIISPRGMLEPWSLQQSRLKKKIAWSLYQRHSLDHAQVIHATSESEAQNLRRLGLKQPIAVIPNGINLPAKVEVNQTGRTKLNPKTSRSLLFLSRIHPKKGLLNLVQAIKRLSPQGWQVIIAGPDEGGHQAEVEAAVRAAGLHQIFTFPGPIDDEAKWDWYRRADLVVLPTFSENFGIVVTEALACGAPVITTKGTPWQELETHRCGWWVDIGVEPLAQALAEAMRLSDEARFEMGQNGYRLVMDRYTWPALAEQMIAVYRWMLNDGPKPDCVV
ncbi:MAG: glycosyltransferase [Anaerolineaceae bacterium]|nr:glycosyltransferase [Anaerolineaceae bacterium]